MQVTLTIFYVYDICLVICSEYSTLNNLTYTTNASQTELSPERNNNTNH